MARRTNDEGLYLSDDALRARIAPHVGAVRFAKILVELESVGFPRCDRIFDGRYWPSVRDWLDRRHGLRQAGAALVPDGEENWDVEARSDAGSDPPPPSGRRRALLEREKPGARSSGLPRSVDSFTARRHGGGNS
jgi:hypothetical protein